VPLPSSLAPGEPGTLSVVRAHHDHAVVAAGEGGGAFGEHVVGGQVLVVDRGRLHADRSLGEPLAQPLDLDLGDAQYRNGDRGGERGGERGQLACRVRPDPAEQDGDRAPLSGGQVRRGVVGHGRDQHDLAGQVVRQGVSVADVDDGGFTRDVLRALRRRARLPAVAADAQLAQELVGDRERLLRDLVPQIAQHLRDVVLRAEFAFGAGDPGTDLVAEHSQVLQRPTRPDPGDHGIVAEVQRRRVLRARALLGGGSGGARVQPDRRRAGQCHRAREHLTPAQTSHGTPLTSSKNLCSSS
jgi:hypothetical protein